MRGEIGGEESFSTRAANVTVVFRKKRRETRQETRETTQARDQFAQAENPNGLKNKQKISGIAKL